MCIPITSITESCFCLTPISRSFIILHNEGLACIQQVCCVMIFAVVISKYHPNKHMIKLSIYHVSYESWQGYTLRKKGAFLCPLWRTLNGSQFEPLKVLWTLGEHYLFSKRDFIEHLNSSSKATWVLWNPFWVLWNPFWVLWNPFWGFISKGFLTGTL